MLYVLWALLNLGLFLFFVVLCFQATRLLREKSGIWASVVFVIGLLSVVRYSGNNADLTAKANQEAKRSKFVPTSEIIPGTMKHTYLALTENPVSTLTLGVLYGKDTTAYQTAVYDAFTSRTGFTSGYQWTPIGIQVESRNGKFAYRVTGTLEWKLLGFTVYSEPQFYAGEVAEP